MNARSEARAGSGVLAPFLIVGASLALVLVAQWLFADAWVGWAPSAFAASQNMSCLILSVLGALLFSWKSINLRSKARMSSPDPCLRAPEWEKRSIPLTRERFFMVAAWAFVGAAVPTLGVLAYTIATVGSGALLGMNVMLWALWMLGTWAFIAAITLGGDLIGMLLPRSVAIATAGIVAYVAAWFPLLTGNTVALSPFAGYFDAAWFFYEPSLFTAFLRALIWIGVLVALPGIASLSLTWILVSFVVVAMGLGGSVLTGQRLHPVAHAFEASCMGNSPRICTPQPFASSLDTLDEQIRPGFDLLPRSMVPETIGTHRFVTPDISASSLVVDPEQPEPVPSNRPTRNATIASLAQSQFLAQCGGIDEAPQLNLVAYLAFLSKATYGSVPLREGSEFVPATPKVRAALEEARAKAALSDPEFTAWIASTFVDAESCAA